MGNVREVSSYSVTGGFFLIVEGCFLVTKGFFLVIKISERSLPTRTGGSNNVAYASFIEDDFWGRGVFLDFRPQAINTKLEKFSCVTIVWTPDMLEQLGAAAYPSLVLD